MFFLYSLRTWITTTALALIIGLPAIGVAADKDENGNQICSNSDLIAIRSTPGGSQIAQLYPRGCMVQTGEKRENWIKVKIEGWVDENRLPFTPPPAVENQKQNRSQATESTRGEQIRLVSSEILLGAADLNGKATQAQIILRVQNRSGGTIRGWRGILIGRDSSNLELFRYRVSDENASLANDAVGELRLGWGEGDKAFEVIQSRSANNIRLVLTQTTPIR